LCPPLNLFNMTQSLSMLTFMLSSKSAQFLRYMDLRTPTTMSNLPMLQRTCHASMLSHSHSVDLTSVLARLARIAQCSRSPRHVACYELWSTGCAYFSHLYYFIHILVFYRQLADELSVLLLCRLLNSCWLSSLSCRKSLVRNYHVC